MNKKISLGAAIAYMAIVAAVVFCLTMFYSENRYNSMYNNIIEREREYALLSEIDQYARSHYAGELEEETLRAGIASGYISGLGDPYARFLTDREYEAYQQTESQRYVGIGVVTDLDVDGYIRVRTVYPQSPAASAQMQAGDLIVSVDDTAATKDNYTELVGSFRGAAGTKVTLIYRRDTEERTVELTRREIDIPTISTTMLENVAYLRFSSITNNTSQHLEAAIRQASQNGATALIFDIRGIESDNVTVIGNMLDILLGKMTTIYQEDASGISQELMSSDESEVELPMVVLADNPRRHHRAVRPGPAGHRQGPDGGRNHLWQGHPAELLQAEKRLRHLPDGGPVRRSLRGDLRPGGGPCRLRGRLSRRDGQDRNHGRPRIRQPAAPGHGNCLRRR